MRNLLLTAAFLTLGVPAAAAADPLPAAGYDLRVELWAENDRDHFRYGDRVRLRFRTSESAYVAVLHLSPDGELEFLHPRSPWDDGYVYGRRAHAVSHGPGHRDWRVRASSGMGYVYVIASETPLDFHAFRDRYGDGWAFRRIGHVIHGDPFYALDRVTGMLVRDAAYGNHAVDYYTYHVGRRHDYPRYACYDGYAAGYRGWGEHYHSCDRLRVLLLDDPYYYDTRYYDGYRQGYRRGYLSGARASQPRHRYKEREEAVRRDLPPLRARPGRGGDEAGSRPEERARPEGRSRPEPGARVSPSPYSVAEWERRQQGQREPEQQQRPRREEAKRPERRADPPRTRPTLQRREPERERAKPRAAPPRRAEPRREEPRAAPPPREERTRPSEERPPTVAARARSEP